MSSTPGPDRPDTTPPEPGPPASGVFAEPGSTPGDVPPSPVPPPDGAPVPPPPDTGFEPPLAPPPGAYAPPPIESGIQPPRAPAPGSTQMARQMLAGDWTVVGAGFLTFLFTLLDGYYTVTVTLKVQGIAQISRIHRSGNAWHSPPFGWLGGLLALAAAVLLAAEILSPARLSYPARRISGVLMAVAALFTFLALFIHPTAHVGGLGSLGLSIDVGHGAVYWICLLLAVVGAVTAWLRLVRTGPSPSFRPPG